MTYQAYEASPTGGNPVELYVFQIGAEVYRYTSLEGGYTWGGYDFIEKQVKRTATTQSSETRNQELVITLPASDVVGSRYIGVVPAQRMSLSIVRVHIDDPDQEGYTIWQGRILGASFVNKSTVCQLRGLTTESALSRQIPRRKYQGPCNHTLYDGNCGVSKASFQYDGEVLSVSGNTVTVDGLSAKGDDWAQGGYVALANNDWRQILEHKGNVLTLMLAFKDNAVGATVSVYAGCGHSLAVCNSKFSNTVNFGGFPYVPKRNPFVSGVA